MNQLLLRPFAYLTITHSSARLPFLNWGLPLLIGAGLCAAGALTVPHLNLFHAGGLFDKMVGFIQNLPGFYLAALAAVATFGRPGLDNIMPGTPAKVRIPYNAQLVEVELTRRRFVTMMFSYLTALSIGLTLFGIGAQALVDQASILFPPEGVPVARAAVAFVFLLFVAQMVVITLWGLYYLGERIHATD